MIKGLVEDYYETDKLPTLTKEKDPFWDPPEA
jgi:hypothetical protein